METVNTFAVPLASFNGEIPVFTDLMDKYSMDKYSMDKHLMDKHFMDKHSMDKPVKPIEITCVTITGQQIKMSLDRHNTVLQLKKNIYKKTDIMLDDQRIVFGGKQLQDTETLDTYNIANGDKVHLVTRLRGGMFHKTSGRADFVSLNFITKFQKGAKMIHGLRFYGLHLDTLAQLDKYLQRCETDEEIDKIYKLIEDVYIL
jgi:hypothetical protein